MLSDENKARCATCPYTGTPATCPNCHERAAREEERAKAQATERGWLIEISGPKWFMAGPRWNWTKNASEAVRFARREDAEAFGRWSSLDVTTGECLRYTEHEWPKFTKAQAAPVSREDIARIFDDAIGEHNGYSFDGGAGSMCWDEACSTLKDRVLAILAQHPASEAPTTLEHMDHPPATWTTACPACVQEGYNMLSQHPASDCISGGGWRPIESAPRDGTHILACIGPYSENWGFAHRPPAVIHWWDCEGEEGFYLSAGGSPDEPSYPATHWMPLPAPPTSGGGHD